MEYGVQMFGLNPLYLNDKENALKQIHDAGFTSIEPCVVLKGEPKFPGHYWTEKDFEDDDAIIRDAGLSTVSMHMSTGDLLSDLPAAVRIAHAHGVTQTVMSCPSCSGPDEYKKAAEMLVKAAEAFRKEGLDFQLHNGDRCCTDRIGDRCVYEWVLDECGNSVGAQADTGWLVYGGCDLKTFFEKHRGQIRSLHYKDMEETEDGLKETGVGTGIIDMKLCFDYAAGQGIPQLLDQDRSKGNFFDDIRFVGNLLRQMEKG